MGLTFETFDGQTSRTWSLGAGRPVLAVAVLLPAVSRVKWRNVETCESRKEWLIAHVHESGLNQKGTNSNPFQLPRSHLNHLSYANYATIRHAGPGPPLCADCDRLYCSSWLVASCSLCEDWLNWRESRARGRLLSVFSLFVRKHIRCRVLHISLTSIPCNN